MKNSSRPLAALASALALLAFGCSQFRGVSDAAHAEDYDPEARLEELGIVLPEPPRPVANYVNGVRTGNLIFLAGKGPKRADGTEIIGKLGADVSIEEGYEGARLTAINQLAVLKDMLGNLNRVKRIVKVLGMVNSDPSFVEQPKVINGFSDLIVEVFGERGRHARAAVGMASLPRGQAVEIEMIVEVDDSAPTKAPVAKVAPEPFSYRRIGSLGTAALRTASISIGDVDADGDLDFVVANGRHWPGQNKVFLNDGEGSFTDEHKLSADQSTTYTAALADLDGDGDLDAVVGNDSKPSYVNLNDGDGHFVKGSQVGKISNTRSVTLADLDGKNGIDVILTNRREANLICFNDGNGGFARQATFGAKTDPTINVATWDIDGDGDLDIVVANREDQQNYIYLNDGAGGFSETVPYGTGSDATRGVALADIDGDGHIDILNANIGQPNAVYFGNGSTQFERSIEFGEDAQSYALAPADLNGDGRIDIVVANVRGPNAIYLQGTDGSFEKFSFGAPRGMTYGLVVADWNGDGRPEIATANSDGQNYLYGQNRR